MRKWLCSQKHLVRNLSKQGSHISTIVSAVNSNMVKEAEWQTQC